MGVNMFERKKYKIKNLYIVRLGRVLFKKDGNNIFERTDKYLLVYRQSPLNSTYKKIKFDYLKSEHNYKEVFTKERFYPVSAFYLPKGTLGVCEAISYRDSEYINEEELKSGIVSKDKLIYVYRQSNQKNKTRKKELK